MMPSVEGTEISQDFLADVVGVGDFEIDGFDRGPAFFFGGNQSRAFIFRY